MSTLTLVVLAMAAPAVAQDGEYGRARLRYLEPGVTLQRGSEPGADEAALNMPFLPGDRVWTDESGRAEFQFEDGSSLRLDSRSKLDYLAPEERRSGEIALHLWSGGLYLHVRRGSSFEIETPGGLVEADDRGVLRIDAEAGETRLTVYEGEATLDSGRRRVRVEAGERTYARRGEAPERPRGFDRAEDDDFARWDREREGRSAWAGDSRRYLPEEVAPYGDELESHGSWYYQTEVGYVWRPFVGVDWRPYCDGRWIWTAYGWTWVPYEAWGWAPFHYGRWDWSPGLGWYWIPGPTWGPAWVTWAFGADYVGWCPLGYRDRPVIVYDGRGGRAVPRGSGATSADAASSKAWVMVRKGDLTLRDIVKRRVDTTPAQVREVHILESPHQRPTRDLTRVVEHPLGRDVKTKPTIGDWVPELRTDPKTTIPSGVPRTRRRVSDPPTDRHERTEQPKDVGHPTDVVRPTERVRVTTPEAREREGEREHPSDRVRTRPLEERPKDRDQEQERAKDQDRDVLRRFFQPVSEPRTRDEGEGSRRRPETSAPRKEPRSEPRTAPPPRPETPRTAPPSSSRSSSDHATKRDKKDKP